MRSQQYPEVIPAHHMRRVVISASSLLVPGHKAWASLQRDYAVEFGEYGDWSGALLRSSADDPVAVVLHLDDLTRDDAVVPSLGPMLTLLRQRLAQASGPTVVAVCSGEVAHVIRNAKRTSARHRAFGELLVALEELAAEFPSFYFIDLDRQFATLGTERAFDSRNWYFARCRFSASGLQQVADALERVLARHARAPAKVLVLDCDNTLWGGVVGEDGVEGLTLGQDGLGQAFADFQRVARSLAREGVLLVLASKNNESDVWSVFDKHPSMVLRREDFVAWKIDWREKAENIRQLAGELDLGLDSFVFWDDNPVERDKARLLVPEVNTVDVPRDVQEWPRFLRGLDCLARFSVTDDDLQKGRQYQARAMFVRDSHDVADTRSYLRSIGLQPVTQGLVDSNISRAAQLCAKTNQFNLRTVRHAAEDLRRLCRNDDGLCFLAGLRDVYGDHGMVGLACARTVDAQTAMIDTFLMSCRVLGRHFESWMLSELVRRCRTRGLQALVGEFVATGRNAMARDFLPQHGFEPLHAQPGVAQAIARSGLSLGGALYVLSLDHREIPNADLYDPDPS